MKNFFISLFFIGALSSASLVFADYEGLSDADLVTWGHTNGITSATTPDEFHMQNHLSRQEAAAILVRATEGATVFNKQYASYPDNCNTPYKDETKFDKTLQSEIYQACALGIMYGSNGYFSPLRGLTRAEALAILIRAVDGGKKDESGSPWYGTYMDRAHELHILEFANMKGFDDPITRWELLEWIYAIKTNLSTK